MFTEAMLFGTSQRLAKVDQFSVSVNGSAIKCVTEFNYLGVILMNTSAGTNMLKKLCRKLAGGSLYSLRADEIKLWLTPSVLIRV